MNVVAVALLSLLCQRDRRLADPIVLQSTIGLRHLFLYHNRSMRYTNYDVQLLVIARPSCQGLLVPARADFASLGQIGKL